MKIQAAVRGGLTRKATTRIRSTMTSAAEAEAAAKIQSLARSKAAKHRVAKMSALDRARAKLLAISAREIRETVALGKAMPVEFVKALGAVRAF